MDADAAADRPAAQINGPTNGGSVEPANRAAVAKARFQTPEPAGERYELRDPLADVTYRTANFDEMAAKARQLGRQRFVAVAEDGQRTTVQQVDGRWQRGEPRAAAPVRPAEPGISRDEVPDASNVVPLPGAPVKAPEPGIEGAVAKIEADAERTALAARLQAALTERYVIKRAPVTIGDVTVGRTEYRFRGDTTRVAFTESTFRLATDTNSPSVARSMVDVAQARQWKALRVLGHEDFRRMVWLEASVRGVKALGYEPSLADLDLLKKEREARLVNRIEPERGPESDGAAGSTDKASAGRGGGRKAVLAAIEAVLVAKKVPEAQRAAVMAAATEKLAQRTRDGQAPKVRIYDKAAPSQRPAVVPTPETQRARDRATPAPTR